MCCLFERNYLWDRLKLGIDMWEWVIQHNKTVGRKTLH